jgi:hypothetical protein
MRPQQKCDCGSGEYHEPMHDGYGIFLFYCCPRCERSKLNKYRPDILERYDTDEQIESDY